MKEKKHAENFRAYAIGEQRRNGFHVRRIVWGKLMASHERRHEEEIRPATILVGETKVRPVSIG